MERRPRVYQREALDAFWACRDQHLGVLFELFTGAGKTYLASEIARAIRAERRVRTGRTLFLCNRRVLGAQSLDELALGTGCRWMLEQAEHRALRNSDLPVVALVQTMQGKRLEEWPKDAFDQVIVDEVHVMTGKEYRRPQEYFAEGGAKLLGLSATPDGAKGYGKLYTHTAFAMDLVDAMEGAWSVPLDFQYFTTSVDLDSISWKKNKAGGDFDVGQLDEEIAKAAAEIRAAAFDICGDKKTLIRCPGVKSIITAVDAMNEMRPGCARPLYGEMSDTDKTRNVADHKAGRYQFLVSCQMIGFGYDDKHVQALLNARPTTSRSDAVQWWGRGSRLWSGIGEIDDTEERRAAIAASPKPSCLVVELNAKSKHELATPTTIFGKGFSEEEKKLAKKKMVGGGNPMQALQAAREEIAAREARKQAAKEAKVQLKAQRDADAALDERRTSTGERALTRGQERKLTEFGVPFDANMTKAKATELLRKEYFAMSRGWCTYKTRVALEEKIGVRSAWAMSVATAKRLRDAWVRGGKLRMSQEQIHRVLSLY
jgi:superfamily II DNA or RNA helicase